MHGNIGTREIRKTTEEIRKNDRGNSISPAGPVPVKNRFDRNIMFYLESIYLFANLLRYIGVNRETNVETLRTILTWTDEFSSYGDC